ncbi:unnamed protein product, partial [Rotaria socialis]
DSTTTSSCTSKEKSKPHSSKSQIDTHGAAASTSKKSGINSITGQMFDVKISASINEANLTYLLILFEINDSSEEIKDVSK